MHLACMLPSPHPKLRFPLASWGVKGMPFSEPALRVHALLVAATGGDMALCIPKALPAAQAPLTSIAGFFWTLV